MNMTPVCPFVKAARPDDNTSKKSVENSAKHQVEPESKVKKESNDTGNASPKCPFGYDSASASPKCPLGYDSASASPKCPFGYDSQSFKLGPLSCMICQALLFESSRCMPCSHVFCK